MLKIHQVYTEIDEKLNREHIAAKLRCPPSDIISFKIDRQSLDARHSELRYSYSVFAEVKRQEKYLRRKDVAEGNEEKYILPEKTVLPERPVVAGFGPAGMFAALILAECGCCPVVIERGRPVEQRTEDVERFFKEGILDPESNVQYGEGGAGTFSDGKLTTRIKNHRIRKVLEEFVEAGASPEIMYQAMPHLGTDQLVGIVKNIREKIIRLGGEVRFETKAQRIVISQGKLSGVETSRGMIECTDLIAALGHSARETYESLLACGIEIFQKDFAAGIRVEHPQEMINRNQYGKFSGSPGLPAASYRLAFKASSGRGVYSFCMCPGGIVIPASTEEGMLAVNGMSYSGRSGNNANSAILVQIPRRDFDHGHPLDGYVFQSELEKRAWRRKYQAPSQNIADYLKNRKTESPVLASSYPRGNVWEDMHGLFSEEVNLSLAEAFSDFDRRIPGFITQGIMVGMESRSSSPIRMERDERGVSISCSGLYPCGEGAGYAGGIVSSAVDGIRQAENLIANYRSGLK